MTLLLVAALAVAGTFPLEHHDAQGYSAPGDPPRTDAVSALRARESNDFAVLAVLVLVAIAAGAHFVGAPSQRRRWCTVSYGLALLTNLPLLACPATHLGGLAFTFAFALGAIAVVAMWMPRRRGDPGTELARPGA
jgi:hypothetical protein